MPQVAVLGCTHYPLVRDVFEDVLGETVQVYSQEQLCAQSLIDYLNRHPRIRGKHGGRGQNDIFNHGGCGQSIPRGKPVFG